MRLLAATLVGDGTSDRCLKSPIEWLLARLLEGSERPFRLALATPASSDLAERLRAAYRQFPCDLLFVHRDAEAQTIEKRREEVRAAAAAAGIPSFVPVVPVRMTEAWLLIDEGAIRKAADNPHSAVELPLPPLRKLEQAADPKRTLRECLLTASEKQGRHLKRFKRDLDLRVVRVAELIEDFAPLRKLAAFQAFEEAARESLALLMGDDDG